MAKYIHVCQVCGKQFETQYTGTLYCSTKCRQKRQTELNKDAVNKKVFQALTENSPKTKNTETWASDLALVLVNLKNYSTILRAFARSTPPGIATRLLILAECIDVALKEVDL